MSRCNSLKICLLIMAVFFLALNSSVISALVFIFLDVILVIIALSTTDSWRQRITTFLSYGILLTIQLYFCLFLVDSTLINQFALVFMTYFLLILSFIIEAFIELKNYQMYFFHAPLNTASLLFSDLEQFSSMIKEKSMQIDKALAIMSRDNIQTIIEEISRNNSFEYINSGTLTRDYFNEAEKSMADSSVYIVLSDTGSITSQIVSLFTEKSHNHASIAFDKDLKTLISYNGGERINPPGLNSEMLSYLCKSEDATIYVYRLRVSEEQKRKMIEKVYEINKNGSAYNVIGLVLKRSFKPNIMYCSQFVYSLLKYAGTNYFEKSIHDVKPTDLVELDYMRKLEFVQKIDFS